MLHRSPRFDLLIAAVSLCSLAILATPGSLLAQGPFPCSGDAFIVQDRNPPVAVGGQLTAVTQAMMGFDFTNIGTEQVEYNNIGFNRTDGFIYGLELVDLPGTANDGNNGIIRVGNNGSITNLMAVTTNMSTTCGVSFPSNIRFDAGDVSEDGAHLYINQAGRDRLYIVDITTDPPVLLHCPEIRLGGNPISINTNRVNDWAFNDDDGNLYGGDRDDDQVARLDLDTYLMAPGATITRTDFAVTGDGFTGTEAFGGAWFNALGTLFLYRNAGTIFDVIDVTGGAPTMEVIDSQGGPGSTRNDGAACAQDFVGAAKSMVTNNPGSLPATITITYTFENFSDTLPLTSLSAIDNLLPVFGMMPDVDNDGGDDWNLITPISGALANPSFNGGDGMTPDNELFAAGSSLAANSTTTITVMLELRTENADTDMDQIYCNSVVFTGELDGVSFGDTSTDGNNPDPNDDDAPVEDDPSCMPQVPVELQSFSID